ncbi:MAG TPA: ATP synthase F1 subunit epsilon [Verrucomicrobiae bacterium]|nr:ATP synthase F1 subunit epsilon [Verrucomicrobiae bacterium]
MYQLSIVTPDRVFYEGEVASLTAPGMAGYLGVLTGHAPLLTPLATGKLTFRDASGKNFLAALSGGFLEVSKKGVILLADSIEFPNEIDRQRAERAAEKARQRLAKKEGIDIPRATASLKRAENRLAVVQEAMLSANAAA